MIRKPLVPGSALLAIAFSGAFSRSWKCGRLAMHFGLLAALSCGMGRSCFAQATAQFTQAQRVLFSGLTLPTGVAVDSSGNVHIAEDAIGGEVLTEKLSGGSYTQSTIRGFLDNPEGVAVDSSGNIYIADTLDDGVWKVTGSGGSYTVILIANNGTNGLNAPKGVAVDSSGNVYIADTGNNRVLEETLSGSSYTQSVVANNSSITLNSPEGVAVDSNGTIYVADTGNNRVQKVTPILFEGQLLGYAESTIASGLDAPAGVAVDSSGNVYIADTGNNRVLEETLAGGSYTQSVIGSGLNEPWGVAVDSSGNIYIVEYNSGDVLEEQIRAAEFGSVAVGTTSARQPLTFTFDSAGSLSSTTPYQVLTQGAKGLDFKAATMQGANVCNGTTVYAAGDTCTVRVNFTPTKPGTRYGAVELLNAGGSPIATAYLQGAGVGALVNFLPGTQSVIANAANNGLNAPAEVAVDGNGNVYIADELNNRVLKETLSAGSYTESIVANSANNGLSGPRAVAIDGSGNVYIADYGNLRVLKETLSPSGYSQSVVANSANNGLSGPNGVAVDGSGNVYIADLDSSRVLKETLSAGGYSQSVVANSASNSLDFPYGVAVDGSGNVYIADTFNNRVLKETLSAGSYTQTVIANAASNGLNLPIDVTVDGSGNVYIADSSNNRVLKETLSAGSYTQTVIANNATNGLSAVDGVAVDGRGNVYIADSGNSRVLKEDFADAPSLTFASTDIGSTSTDSPRAVTLINYGNALLSFPVPSSGNNPSISANFTLKSGGALACPEEGPGTLTEATLAPDAYCDLYISFTPTSGGAGTQAGSIVVTDNSSGPANATQSISLGGIAIGLQAITFPPPASPVNYGVPPITLYASGGGSGNPIVFSIVSGPGSLSPTNNNTLTITGVGTVVVAANQAGSTDFAAAPQVTQSIVVNPSMPPTLTTPTPGLSTILGTTNVTFQWTSVPGATEYQFDLSAIAWGDSDLLVYKGTATTLVGVTLPANGVTVYATIYSKINGVWLSNSYLYTESGTPTQAALTSPTPGLSTILGTANVTFHWTAGIAVSQYQLNLSAIAPGNSDLFSYKGAALTTTAATLPGNGAKLYARLYSKINGAWQYNDYVYAEGGTPSPAALTSPTPGLSTILGTSNVVFKWSAGIAVADYQLNLSAIAPGESDLFVYKGTALTATAPTLPAKDEKVFARLYSYINGVWQHNDYVYTESGTPTPAALTSPTPGLSTVLGTSDVTFKWNAGVGVTDYQLNLSAIAAGASELYLYKGTALTATATSLPANGVKVYARLYSYINGVWQYNDYVYTEQ